MTSDRGNTGGTELTTPVSPEYMVQWDGQDTVLHFEKPGLNPNASVYKPAVDQWEVNVNVDYPYTNGDIGKDEGTTPLPDMIDNPMVFYEANHSIDNGEDPLADLDDDEKTRQLIKSQLEACLSRENLASDTYLQSQMDADQYVAIATVAQLEQISQLTNNLDLIVELLKECPNVQLDEKGEKVRPNHNRCTVILREIPDDTPLEDVKGLFASEKCPKFASCEFAHNSNWFVTFESDTDAQIAYQYLREEVKTFQGKPIMARIKAKPLIKVTYPRNGYNRYRNQQANQQIIQQSPQPAQQTQQPTEQQHAQPQTPQFQVQQQVPIMPSIPSYGQSPMPFFPNPNILQWQTSPMLDPSMVSVNNVLAINGYQATSVKLNAPPRNPFPNMNRNNRPPRQQANRPNQDRVALDNRPSQDRLPQTHRTSPRMSEISGHHSYQSRRYIDSNANHSHMTNNHMVDNNSNITTGRQSEIPSRYKSRRKPPLNGNPRLSPHSNMKDKQEPFDYESSSFPPLSGPSTTSASTSTTSNEVFESKLSDVVKGTAKPMVRETKPQTNTSQPAAPASPTPPRPSTPPTQKDSSNNSSSAMNGTSAISSTSSTPTRVPSPPPVSPQKSHKHTNDSPPQKPVTEVIQTPVKVAPVTASHTKVSERERPSPSPLAKLSYAQMVQKGKESDDPTAENKTDDNNSDTSGNESPPTSRKTLKEQSQTQKSTPTRTPSKEHGRREYEPKEQRYSSGRRPAKENRNIDRRPPRRDRMDRESSRSSVTSAAK